MRLKDYIKDKFNGSQMAFATAQGVKPPQVTQWIDKGFIVVDDVLYSPRRELNKYEQRAIVQKSVLKALGDTVDGISPTEFKALVDRQMQKN